LRVVAGCRLGDKNRQVLPQTTSLPLTSLHKVHITCATRILTVYTPRSSATAERARI